MNATLEQIYAKHDPKVLLERIFVKGANPEGHNQYTGKQEAFDAGFTQRDPSDIRQWNKEGISKSGLVSHLKEHGFKPGDSLVTPKGTAEFYESEQGIAYSWRPKKGRGHDAIAMFKSDAKDVKRHPIRYRNPTFHNQVAEITSSLATRIETLLARDNRPTYYAPDQPELHNAVRDRAQAIYQRAVDRSVDYAAAKAAQLVADRKAEAKKRAAAEEEIILLFLMLMADAGEEAFETSTVGLEGVLGEEPEVVPATVLKEFVEQRRAVLSGFPIEMAGRLTRIVTEGIERGQTDREIRSTIAKEASAIKKGQGSVVSLTEAQCTYGSAEIRLLKRAGFETCYWVTEGDEKVRQSHRECEEAGEITIGHEFPNGLRFPGDPQGSAAEVCNCRCNLIGGRRKSSLQATAHDVSGEKRDNAGKWTAGGKSQTETTEFKAWFGDSKVVDKDGNVNWDSVSNEQLAQASLRDKWELWKKHEAAPGKYTVWLFADQGDAGNTGRFATFKSKEDYQKWQDEYPIPASGRAAPERTFYRSGDIPESYISINQVKQSGEGGVSSYYTPEATSMAGGTGRKWYFGKGRQVGVGSDDEPIIIPTEKWKVFHPTQIKSAIGNSGKFDPKDPRITSSSVIWRKQP